MDIAEALHSELSNVSGLSSKVFPLEAPQGQAVPYCIYSLNSAERTKVLSGYDALAAGHYQIELYHSSYANVVSLGALVLAKLKTFDFRVLGTGGPYCQSCEIVDEVETYDPETKRYQKTIDIQISYREA